MSTVRVTVKVEIEDGPRSSLHENSEEFPVLYIPVSYEALSEKYIARVGERVRSAVEDEHGTRESRWSFAHTLEQVSGENASR